MRSDPQNLNLLEVPNDKEHILAEWHFYASGPDKKIKKRNGPQEV